MTVVVWPVSVMSGFPVVSSKWSDPERTSTRWTVWQPGPRPTTDRIDDIAARDP
jgi:hypothetical protein